MELQVLVGACKGSFTPRDKAKAGMTWIFNFYLPIFCRKNILGVVWKLMDSCLTILGVHHLTSVKVVFLSVTI